MNNASAIRFEPARAEHADVFLAMMGALEAADPGTTPFDEPRRRAIFQEFVRDNTYGQAWLILEGDQHVGYLVLTVSFCVRDLQALCNQLTIFIFNCFAVWYQDSIGQGRTQNSEKW